MGISEHLQPGPTNQTDVHRSAGKLHQFDAVQLLECLVSGAWPPQFCHYLNLPSLPDRVSEGLQRMSVAGREVADLATTRTAAAAAVDRMLHHCRQSTDASEVAAAEASALAKDGSGALSLQTSDGHFAAESMAAASERGASQSRPGADSHCLRR